MAKVAKRRGTYVLDFCDQHGKRRWETLPDGTTRKQADQALAVRLQQVRSLDYQSRSDEITFDELADEYFKNHIKVNVRASTAIDYQYMIAFHLRPYFGRRRLRTITLAQRRAISRRHAERVAATCLASASGILGRAVRPTRCATTQEPSAKSADDFLREAPRTVGARTAGKCLTLLAMMFKYARRHHWMTYDPSEGVRKPKPTVRRVDRSEILSPAEMRKLIAHADGRWQLMLNLALYCGLRSGEVRGLQWGDIEWSTHRLWVRRAADSSGQKLQAPKTDAGTRAVGIPDHLISELKRWKLAVPRCDLDLVFPTGAGGIENASNFLNRGLHPALRRAGIRRIDIHSLRHAFASLMITADVNLKALQITMGHSSFRVTMDTYAHLVPGTRDIAVNRVAEIVLTAPEIKPASEAEESGSKSVATPICPFGQKGNSSFRAHR